MTKTNSIALVQSSISNPSSTKLHRIPRHDNGINPALVLCQVDVLQGWRIYEIKGSYLPLISTAVAFRRGEDSYQTFTQKASYLWDKDEGHEWYNLAKRTFELTKSFMSIRVCPLADLWHTAFC